MLRLHCAAKAAQQIPGMLWDTALLALTVIVDAVTFMKRVLKRVAPRIGQPAAALLVQLTA